MQIEGLHVRVRLHTVNQDNNFFRTQWTHFYRFLQLSPPIRMYNIKSCNAALYP